MNRYLRIDPWKIIEDDFNPKNQRNSESLFSLGNCYMGQRANFEEHYSGDTLLGNYIAGIYYPDPTKVGWWKNGYPEYYARIVNIANWIGIDIKVDDETLDLATCKVSEFVRILHMREGYLERSFIAELKNGKQVKINAKRFLSIIDKEIGAIKYSITPLNGHANLTITPYINTDVNNESSNWNETFLQELSNAAHKGEAYTNTVTKKSDYYICTGMRFNITKNNVVLDYDAELIQKPQYVANKVAITCQTNETITIYKYGANITSRDHNKDALLEVGKTLLEHVATKGFATMLEEHQAVWAKRWEQNDIVIEGDIATQQALRFNIFQLAQTYNGEDPRLNVGPKGFTGEKYGATTQWDSEAYCLPYYLSTAKPEVAKNLLLYRYNHLSAAIANAKTLGFTNDAALYPMATVDGTECQNEWEITFEEIHRNGTIAYAIYNYVNYTGDLDYLVDYGLEVLIAIARFWSQRISFSTNKNKYVMLGITGPNEYENNINNNWYTNTMACWTMEYTLEAIEYIKETTPERYDQLNQKLHFDVIAETKRWRDIIANMYLPLDEKTGVLLQQEGYLDKAQILAKDLNPAERPLNQHWSWDRILRSGFIKQADVLQGIFLFLDKYDKTEIKRNFDFYEPRTVHESSLSPCIHAALAARLGYLEQAYDLFIRSTRLDLDDYNNEVAGGCHITSMCGSWMALVYGFAGMWVKNNQLHFNPSIVPQWQSYTFKILFNESLLTITVTHGNITITSAAEHQTKIAIGHKEYVVSKAQEINVATK